MPNKVIHVSDELHLRVKNHCEANKLQMSVWLEGVLREALGKKNKEKLRAVSAPVKRGKKIQTGEPVKDGPKPWEEKPFWERGEETNDISSGELDNGVTEEEKEEETEAEKQAKFLIGIAPSSG